MNAPAVGPRPDPDALLEAIRVAVRDGHRARRFERDARDRRDDLIRAAHRAGIARRDIANAAEVNRAMVHRIATQEPS